MAEWTYRLRDLCIAVAALTVFSPLMAFISLALLLTQKRIFFTQLRPGLGEKPFRLIKFSTLRDLATGVPESGDLTGRMTPVGKWLRKSSLDELPQLLNVIRGEMALVGPRPLLMEYLPLYTSEERIRHTVRPGLTGWAQVNGRNALTFKQRFKLDLWYVEHRSHRLDIRIMAMTLGRMFRAKNVFFEGEKASEVYDGTN